MAETLITKILELEVIDVDIYRGYTTLIGPKTERVFGGQVVGQALHAASLSLPEGDKDRLVHSLHSYFIRPGNPDIPILYFVSRTRDGRSFTTRSVRAVQSGCVIFHMVASFQVPETGMTHQSITAPEVAGPEACKSQNEIYRSLYLDNPRLPEKIRVRLEALLRYPVPIDKRPCSIERYTKRDGRNQQTMWMKSNGSLPAHSHAHHCVAAYCSDMALVDTLLLPHKFVHAADPRLMTASLDHTMYFHKPFKADEWLLYDVHCTITSGGRGLAFGRFFQNGELVCSTIQEGLIRIRKKKEKEPATKQTNTKSKL